MEIKTLRNYIVIIIVGITISSFVSRALFYIIAFIQGVIIFQDVQFALPNTLLATIFGVIIEQFLCFPLRKSILTVKAFS